MTVTNPIDELIPDMDRLLVCGHCRETYAGALPIVRVSISLRRTPDHGFCTAMCASKWLHEQAKQGTA
jgi:hypothetical protein